MTDPSEPLRDEVIAAAVSHYAEHHAHIEHDCTVCDVLEKLLPEILTRGLMTMDQATESVPGLGRPAGGR